MKIVVVGDGTVGKTCVLIRYSKDEFPRGYVPTIFDNYNNQVLVNGSLINLGLWDTAGQEEYERMRTVAYPGANVFLIIFDVTQKSTFENATKKWFPEVKKAVGHAKFVFVGNKSDLRDLSKTGANGAHVSAQTAQQVV